MTKHQIEPLLTKENDDDETVSSCTIICNIYKSVIPNVLLTALNRLQWALMISFLGMEATSPLFDSPAF